MFVHCFVFLPEPMFVCGFAHNGKNGKRKSIECALGCFLVNLLLTSKPAVSLKVSEPSWTPLMDQDRTLLTTHMHQTDLVTPGRQDLLSFAWFCDASSFRFPLGREIVLANGWAKYCQSLSVQNTGSTMMTRVGTMQHFTPHPKTPGSPESTHGTHSYAMLQRRAFEHLPIEKF